MIKFSTVSRLYAVTACLVGLAGAVPAAAQPRPDTLRIALAQAPGPLDPVLDRMPAGFAVLANLCDTLVRLAPDGTLAPALARSWSFSPDARTLTLALRADAGVDAAAVKASLDRARTLPNSARRAELAPVVSVAALDETTVRLDLDRPFVPLLAQLAGRAGMIATAGADDGADALCAGPYRLEPHAADGTRVLVLDDAHWDRANHAFARVEFVPVANPALRLARLRAGTLDLVGDVTQAEAADLADDRRVRVVRGPAQGWRAILFNLRHGPFAGDFRPRAALAAALGGGEAAHGLAFALTVPNEAADVAQAQAIRARTQAAGIAIRLRVLDPAAAAQRVQNRDFEAALVAWPGRADPDGDFHAQFHCRGALNDSGYCAPAVDAALDAARATADPAARAALYAAATARLRADLPVLFLDPARPVFALSARLADFVPAADGVPRVRGLTLREPAR